jgi:hypothetical protein
MDRKLKKFNDLIFELFNDSKHYDKINFSFSKIRKILIEDTPEFENLSVQFQFELISTIYHISVGSKRGVMNDISIFMLKEKDKHTKKYDIDYGFIQPEYIEINGEKILMLE